MDSQDIEKVLYVDLAGLGRLPVDSVRYVPSGQQNTLESGEQGDVGFSSMHRAARLEGSFYKTPNIKIQQLNNFQGAITITSQSGSTYLMSDARPVDEVSQSNGKIDCTFQSINSREVS